MSGWPPGHFYSPVPDVEALRTEAGRSRVWPEPPPQTPGIDWREEEQLTLLAAIAEQDPLPLATGPTGDPTRYHADNEMFSLADAWALQGMLRELGPRRIIEVGGGWSTLVTAQVNRERLGGAAEITCIEPHPSDVLQAGVPGLTELVPSAVQDLPLERFLALESRDVLFIDSSHVVKTGSDAHYLHLGVLPRLRPGVVVHVHDIFLPRDYPPGWVIDQGRAWNEQYVVQALLAHSAGFEVLLGMAFLGVYHRAALREAIGIAPEAPLNCGSLWIRRTA